MDQVSNGNITDDLGLEPNDFVWPEDPEERVMIPFLLSQREFTAILSSVDVGADIAYPEQYIEVYYFLVRSLRYRVPICEAIIHCIMNDEDTRDTIINMLLNNDGFIDGIRDVVGGKTPVNPGEITLPIVEDCDKDVLFGAITSIVTAMNRVNEDAFEIMEEATNDEERIALIVEAIPALSEFIPTELVDLAQQLVENMQENYSAEWTTAVEDKIRMDLLCLAEKDCKITLGMVYDYFNTRLGASLSIATLFTDAIAFLATGDFPGQQVVNFAFMLQLVALRGGSDFFGVSLYSIELQAQLGANNPNNDWTLLEEGDCPDEDTPCIEYSMDTAAGNYYGHYLGKNVVKGDKITITATGAYRRHPSYPYDDADGDGTPSDLFLSPTAKQAALMAQVEGEGDREWHEIGIEGEFTAPRSGRLMGVLNEYFGGAAMTATSQFADNDGTLELEICVEPVIIQLEKTAPVYKLTLISPNNGEPIYELEAVGTGHYIMSYNVEVYSREFYVKAVHVINPDQFTDDAGKLGMGTNGIGAWTSFYQVPMTSKGNTIALQNLSAGTKVRLTLTLTEGEVGVYAPVTTGPL
jgi:hypothetical protein